MSRGVSRLEAEFPRLVRCGCSSHTDTDCKDVDAKSERGSRCSD